jgi:hypothetical protein
VTTRVVANSRIENSMTARWDSSEQSTPVNERNRGRSILTHFLNHFQATPLLKRNITIGSLLTLTAAELF